MNNRLVSETAKRVDVSLSGVRDAADAEIMGYTVTAGASRLLIGNQLLKQGDIDVTAIT